MPGEGRIISSAGIYFFVAWLQDKRFQAPINFQRFFKLSIRFLVEKHSFDIRLKLRILMFIDTK